MSGTGKMRWVTVSRALLVLLLLSAGIAVAWRGRGGGAELPAGRIGFRNDSLAAIHTHSHDRLHVARVREGLFYALEDHFAYVSEDSGRTFRALGRLPKVDPSPAAQLRDWFARLPVVRRWRGNPGPPSLVVLSSGTLLVFYDHIYRLAPGERLFTPVLSLLDSIHPPFPHGVAVTPDDQVYFGEYAVHASRPPRRVLRGTDDGRRWDVVHTFPQGAISHVHHIQYDGARGRLWIATGDDDHESALLFTDDGFRTLDTLGSGSQDWRIVSLIVTDDHLFWGSDNDQTGSSIFRWSFADHRLDRVVDIGSPSYYSTRLRDGTLAISTTYEPESRFTRDSAPAPATDLWLSRDGGHWHRALSLPYREGREGDYALRGRIHLPSGDHSAGHLLFSPFETTRWHFTTQRWTIHWAER